MSEFSKTVIDEMYKYQKKNNITGECLCHSTILYDFLDMAGFKNLSIKTGVCLSVVSPDDIKLTAHCWVKLNETILEPSYELFKLKGTEYYGTLSEFLEKYGHLLDKKSKKYFIQKVVFFDSEITKVIQNTNATPIGFIEQYSYVFKNMKPSKYKDAVLKAACNRKVT